MNNMPLKKPFSSSDDKSHIDDIKAALMFLKAYV